MAKYYELTRYPKIFEGSYWGNFTGNPNPEINENRNKFVEDFDIQSQVKSPPRYLEKHARGMFGGDASLFVHGDNYISPDHIEVYRTTKREYVILNSPYLAHYPQGVAELEAKGWIHMDKLYHDRAETFYKIVPMKSIPNVIKVLSGKD